MTTPAIVWLRQDLRLADNPALHAAAARGGAVIPLFVAENETHWPRGAASRYWLYQSLAAFGDDLRARGSALILARGDAARVLPALVAATGAGAVYWNRRYEPAARQRDAALKQTLGARCEVRSFAARLLSEPAALATVSGDPYRVFTPYYRACLRAGLCAAALPPPARLPAPSTWPHSLPLAALGLEPAIDWAAGIRARWSFGERAAHARLEGFLDQALARYADARDRPGDDGVSGLSPYLASGEIGPRSVLGALEQARAAAGGRLDAAADAWRRQLVWRDFAYHLLFHFPHVTDAPLRETFAGMPWVDDDAGFEAWTRGRTGFPLVDAGMRELWATGYMHNRVRMVAGSFLTKHLGIDWRRGARWFWDTLVDADLASNSFGWQWSAGCGADAAPYVRIFNPLTQGRRFDPDGRYLRRWLPALENVPQRALHQPGAGGYAAPIIDLAVARRAALERHARCRA